MATSTTMSPSPRNHFQTTITTPSQRQPPSPRQPQHQQQPQQPFQLLRPRLSLNTDSCTPRAMGRNTPSSTNTPVSRPFLQRLNSSSSLYPTFALPPPPPPPAHDSLPYTYPTNLRSILTNSTHPHCKRERAFSNSTTGSPASASTTPRPAAKKVCFVLPPAEDIDSASAVYLTTDLDNRDPSPSPQPLASRPAIAAEGPTLVPHPAQLDLPVHLPQLPVDTFAASLALPSFPQTPLAGRCAKDRIWTWTLGSHDTDDAEIVEARKGAEQEDEQEREEQEALCGQRQDVETVVVSLSLETATTSRSVIDVGWVADATQANEEAEEGDDGDLDESMRETMAACGGYF